MFLPFVSVLLAVLAPSGEAIYRLGAADGGQITAAIAGIDVRVPAAVVACASCHGADGRGGSEGGVVSPDIRWQTLSKPYEVTTANGRRRAPYTARLLRRAIGLGVDSSGNTLGPLMPRFQMSSEQNDALFVYLQALDDVKTPGVNDGTIRVGVLSPPDAALPELKASFRSIIAAFFEEVSRAGVYGRRIEPVFVEQDGSPAERAEAVRRAVREQDVLALAPAFTDGAEEALAGVADEEKVPLLASMTSHPANGSRSYTWTRDLLAGTVQQERLLESYAAQHPPPDGAKTILAPAAKITPSLMDDLPPETRVFVALPATLQDLTPQGVALWKKLAPAASPYRATQLAALATATLFVHALERAGRGVTRESLLHAIDGMNRLHTGFSPALTFGPDRHIGSMGAWIVEATAPEPQPVWFEPEG